MRRLVVLFLPALVLMLLAPAAIAAPPDRTPPTAFTVDLDFGDTCAFPMTAHLVGFTHAITFLDADGDPVRGFNGGRLKVTFTRTDTGFSRTFSISGPTHVAADGTIRGTGTWANPTLDGTWYLAAGNLTLDDAFITVAQRGRAFPLCDVMARANPRAS